MSNIIILSFDTSTSVICTTLYNQGHLSETLIECVDKRSTSQQSSLLIPTLNALLDQQGLRYDMVDHFAVTRGPGSFTGIRIGLATAQGLHLATQIPCFAPTSLQVLAFQGHQQMPQQSSATTSFLSLIDNKRGGYYGQIFNRDIHEQEAAKIWSFAEVQAYREQSTEHHLVSHTELSQGLVPQNSLTAGLVDLLLHLLHKKEQISEQNLSPFYVVDPVYAKRQGA